MRIVTMRRLERALRSAIADFEACGLYTTALHEAPVTLTWCHTAYGLCRHPGQVEIPALSTSRLGELFGRPRVPLTDIVRHELAHALADLHPEHVDTPEFARVFGSAYYEPWSEAPDPDHESFVTEYAASAPMEDFAETVMVYTRHRGRLDRYRRRPGVLEGLRFVARLARRLPT